MLVLEQLRFINTTKFAKHSTAQYRNYTYKFILQNRIKNFAINEVLVLWTTSENATALD